LAGIVQDKLDDFFDNLDATKVSSGDPQRAVTLVKQARQQYKNARKGEILEQVLAKAETGGGARPQIQVLQDRLEPIVNDARLMKKFTPDEREVLKSLQSGTLTENALKKFGTIAPGVNLEKILGYAIPATYAASTDPAYLSALGVIGAGSAAAKAAANRMAMRRASDVAENVLAGRPPPTITGNAMRAAGRGAAYIPPVVLGSEAANNAFLTDAYGRTYEYPAR
jgi:hypothetical protein